MKNIKKLLYIIFCIMILMPVSLSAKSSKPDDKLDQEIQELELQLKEIVSQTGKYAKMSAEKLLKEMDKIQKKLNKKIEQWEKEHGTEYREKVDDTKDRFLKSMNKASESFKNGMQQTAEELNKAAKKLSDELEKQIQEKEKSKDDEEVFPTISV